MACLCVDCLCELNPAASRVGFAMEERVAALERRVGDLPVSGVGFVECHGCAGRGWRDERRRGVVAERAECAEKSRVEGDGEVGSREWRDSLKGSAEGRMEIRWVSLEKELSKAVCDVYDAARGLGWVGKTGSYKRYNKAVRRMRDADRDRWLGMRDMYNPVPPCSADEFAERDGALESTESYARRLDDMTGDGLVDEFKRTVVTLVSLRKNIGKTAVEAVKVRLQNVVDRVVEKQERCRGVMKDRMGVNAGSAEGGGDAWWDTDDDETAETVPSFGAVWRLAWIDALADQALDGVSRDEYAEDVRRVADGMIVFEHAKRVGFVRDIAEAMRRDGLRKDEIMRLERCASVPRPSATSAARRSTAGCSDTDGHSDMSGRIYCFTVWAVIAVVVLFAGILIADG